ncbi:hypothetical protein GCM10020358_80050 [Amorphoplanes nipponensis]|uniref:Uncharacterized protein n=1 Tax=Actinoplanes nipponensis TaxID=135950 RepID=A0A919JMC2_9ACTN|nr:hypothetical protein Ani05nite_53450 [Actinoplanes nipponensis]
MLRRHGFPNLVIFAPPDDAIPTRCRQAPNTAPSLFSLRHEITTRFPADRGRPAGQSYWWVGALRPATGSVRRVVLMDSLATGGVARRPAARRVLVGKRLTGNPGEEAR